MTTLTDSAPIYEALAGAVLLRDMAAGSGNGDMVDLARETVDRLNATLKALDLPYPEGLAHQERVDGRVQLAWA